MTRKLIGISVILLSFTQLACLKSNGDCSFKPCQYPAPASEIQAINSYLTTNSLSATQHCSGVFYSISNAGTGKSPNGCSAVSLTYTGRTSAGSVFDSHTSPVYIDLNQVIAGWRAGLPLIKEGGSLTLYIPPSLGYGPQDVKDNNGNVVIPANSILIFDISLSTVQ